MIDVSDYIGIPFVDNGRTKAGCDCWRLVGMVYRDHLNIELPEFPDVYIDRSSNTALLKSLQRVADRMNEYKQRWKSVDKPQPYDVIILHTGELLYHCGLVVDRRNMLHTMENIDSAIEDFTGLMWKNKIEGFYRYAG